MLFSAPLLRSSLVLVRSSFSRATCPEWLSSPEFEVAGRRWGNRSSVAFLAGQFFYFALSLYSTSLTVIRPTCCSSRFSLGEEVSGENRQLRRILFVRVRLDPRVCPSLLYAAVQILRCGSLAPRRRNGVNLFCGSENVRAARPTESTFEVSVRADFSTSRCDSQLRGGFLTHEVVGRRQKLRCLCVRVP